MRIRLIVATNRQPPWVERGYMEYAKRLPAGLRPELIEIPLARRSRSTATDAALAEEGKRMLHHIPPAAYVVALQETGTVWSTAELAGHLQLWMSNGAPVCLLIGGPDGLAAACIARANVVWSLSRMTFPHGLVKIIVAESLYRAWSLARGHPYHRA